MAPSRERASTRTALWTMVAILAMPRLPTPIATRAPGRSRAAKPLCSSWWRASAADIGQAEVGEILTDDEQARRKHQASSARPTVSFISNQ